MLNKCKHVLFLFHAVLHSRLVCNVRILDHPFPDHHLQSVLHGHAKTVKNTHCGCNVVMKGLSHPTTLASSLHSYLANHFELDILSVLLLTPILAGWFGLLKMI